MKHDRCEMSPGLPRRVPIESIGTRYVLLRDKRGSFLGTGDGQTLERIDEADDRAFWQCEDQGAVRHATTGLCLNAQTVSPSTETGVALKFTESNPELAGCWSVGYGGTRLPSEHLAEMEQMGWTCLPALLDKTIVAGLHAAMDDLPAIGERNRSRTAFINHPAVARTAAEPVSLWLVRRYLRTASVRLAHPPTIAFIDRDDGKQDVQGWHSDFPYLWGSSAAVGADRVPTGPAGDLRLGVQRNVCITDFTYANGATLFQLDSLRTDHGPPRNWGIDADYADAGYRREHGLPYAGASTQVIEASAGSILIYDARIWHRPGINTTVKRRGALLQAMTPMYVLPFIDTSAAMRQFHAVRLAEYLDERERREINRLMIHEIVGPLGRNPVTTVAGQ